MRSDTPSRSASNVAVVTPTASGKTLCYNLPVLQQIVDNPDSRALFLYPTKALTNPLFYAKLALVAVGFVTALVIRRRMRALPPELPVFAIAVLAGAEKMIEADFVQGR